MMPVEPSEDVAKAICSDKYDASTGAIAPSLFKGEKSSVSRLAICPLEDTWDIFRSRVEKPPERTLELIGVINVECLGKIGRGYEPNPTDLTVEAAPIEGYESHAEIPEKISRGLANEIIKKLNICTPS